MRLGLYMYVMGVITMGMRDFPDMYVRNLRGIGLRPALLALKINLLSHLWQDFMRSGYDIPHNGLYYTTRPKMSS